MALDKFFIAEIFFDSLPGNVLTRQGQTFVIVATPNFDDGVVLFKVTCSVLIILQLTDFLPFYSQVQFFVNCGDFLSCSQV